MIKVLRYFTKRSEGFKPYGVGEKVEFDKETEKNLVDNGFAEYVEKEKPKGKKKGGK